MGMGFSVGGPEPRRWIAEGARDERVAEFVEVRAKRSAG